MAGGALRATFVISRAGYAGLIAAGTTSCKNHRPIADALFGGTASQSRFRC